MAKEQQSSESRRDFLKKAGKFAVYTPPALMIMGQSGNAQMVESLCTVPGVAQGNPNCEGEKPHPVFD